MKKRFEEGDIVCFKAAFLREIGWLTDVPINGEVKSATLYPGDQVLDVLWCDREFTSKVSSRNVILYSERSKEPA